MYIKKNDLVCRLIAITGNGREYFATKTVAELNAILEYNDSKENRTYLEVPYKEKEIVKLIGGKFDGDKKKWYVPIGIKSELFARWINPKSV